MQFLKNYYKTKTIKKLSCILLLATLSGCLGNTYKFIPPHSAEGKRCVNECIVMKQSCKNNCSSNKHMCSLTKNVTKLTNHSIKKDSLHRHSAHGHDFDHDFGFNNCNTYSCTHECEEDYRACYENCGGNVISIK